MDQKNEIKKFDVWKKSKHHHENGNWLETGKLPEAILIGVVKVKEDECFISNIMLNLGVQMHSDGKLHNFLNRLIKCIDQFAVG